MTVRANEVALLRLVAQRLAGPGLASAADAVRWMTAAQGQDLPGALTSVALRTASGSRGYVVDALDTGKVVRSWPMRGTLHLVAAEDLPWMLDIAARRTVTRMAPRRAELGLEDAMLERARELAVDALRGGRRLGRKELLTVWQEHALDTTGGRASHILGYLAQTGTLCLGPMRGTEQLVVLTEEWIPRPRRPEREEALGEWAARYFRSHGPATAADFARWTALPAADVRPALALARPQLERLEVDGVEHLMDPKTPDLLRAHRRKARGLFLLPGFDELLLGYADRTAVLATELAERIVPGGNGVFRPTVVHAGQVIGTWKHAGRGAKRTLDATPFESFPPRVTASLPKVYAKLP